ncbi:MAG: hypothetical protein EA351_11705 [Gemmatimonadales bacterium]|nr:MAG: hypothetical protein EA351_11705 [Gemmatimonadales bacterium]
MGLLDRPGSRDSGGGLTVAARVLGAAVVILGVVFALLLLLGAAPLKAQGLADFDYENLTFRGLMLDAGYVMPDGVENTRSLGARLDLGFLGPGVRVTTGFSRWSSRLDRERVRSLEESLESLVFDQTGEEVEVDLGRITLTDFAMNADVHMIWSVPLGVLTYAGVGGTAHVMQGGGESIEDTFVDDLLDQIRAGFNVHAGVELPVAAGFRVVGEGRWEFVQNSPYLQVRIGGQYLWGPRMSGEPR